MAKRNDEKTLILNVPIELHQEIKLRATEKNVPIRTYVIRALMEYIKKEKKHE